VTNDILRVDLTTGVCLREEVPDHLVARFVGGKGLAAHYLMSELPQGTAALTPGSLLIFMTGPVSGIFPGTSRHAVVCKSPATGGFLDSYAGGYFAWELRKAGLMGIIVSGRAEQLSYVEITEDSAVVISAPEFAGLSPALVDDDPRFTDFRVSAIGPAGEHGSVMASIGNNTGKTKRGRSGYNGRGGAGAVMGAKNLKAIAVKGGKSPRVSEAARELRKSLSKRIMAEDSPASWAADCGTPSTLEWTNAIGVLPTRNWSRGSFENASALIGPEAVIRDMVSRDTCFNCPVNCGPHVKASTGVFAGVEAPRLEYETIALAASNTDNGDFSSIVEFSRLCDELGLDTISAGAAVAFAMDCAERGLIDHPIRFGDSEGQVRLTEDIAYGRGIGADLTRGIREASIAWGIDESQVPVVQVKNLECPGYDPRGSVGMALAYATSDRGGCHMRSWPIGSDALAEDPDSAGDPYAASVKAAIVKAEQDGNAAAWCLVACHFMAYGEGEGSAMLHAIGLDISPAEYLKLGERVWNLVRLFNLREGWTAADDTMPAALQIPLEDTGRAIAPALFEEMKADYYRERGWTEDGRPTPELLSRLSVDAYA
jgi:aldehyde:ferredoxin oxidoreductase